MESQQGAGLAAKNASEVIYEFYRMFDRFFDSDSPTQVVLVLALIAVGWNAVWNQESKAPFRSAHLAKVNFLLLLSLVGLSGSLLYALVFLVWPVVIVAMASLCWNLAALTTLAICSGSRFLRTCAAIPILIFVFLLPKYGFSIEALAADIGRTLVCGPTGLREDCAASAAQGAGSVKMSSLVRGAYFSLPLYLLLYYYGRVYLVWRESQVDRGVLDASFLNYLVIFIALSIALIVGLFFAGADVPSLSIFSGLVAAAITLTAADIVRNSIAGIWLIWDKSMKKNDVLTFNGPNGVQEGWVEKMTLRFTEIKDWNGQSTLVPNSTLASSIIKNWTHGKGDDGKGNARLKVDIMVARSTDINNAIGRLVQAARRVKRVLRDPPPQVQVGGVGDFAINLQLRFWINDPKEGIGNVCSRVYLEVLDEIKREDPEKIIIPLPQSEVRELDAPQSDPATLAIASSASLRRRK